MPSASTMQANDSNEPDNLNSSLNSTSLKRKAANAEANRRYRKRQSEKLELAKGLEADGQDLIPELEAARQKRKQTNERKRLSTAENRKAKRNRNAEDGDPVAGSSNISLELPIRGSRPQTWIDDVLNTWDAFPISSIETLHSAGTKILRQLSLLPNPPAAVSVNQAVIKVLGFPTRGSVSPHIRLVRNDLLSGNDHNIVEYISRNPEVDISGSDVMLSMMNLLTRSDMSGPKARLYGALDIRFGSDGIGLCRYRASPYEGDTRCLVDPDQRTTTLTPPGAITHTHMDYYGRQQYFVHLFGEKIWLLWPPTAKNLEIFGEYHTQCTPADLTSRCIGELEGMEVFHVKEETAFILMPNVLHACISLSLCSHLGMWVWQLSEYQKSLSMLRWGLNWLSGKAGGDAPISDYAGELETMKSEVAAWKILLKKNSKEESWKEARKFLNELQRELSTVEMLFNN